LSAKRPPRLATWLAQHLVIDRRRDSLIGDLLERYGERKSNAWYWRQVLLTILACAIQDIADHKVLALRALFVGWALYYLSADVVMWLLPTVRTWVGQWITAQFWADHISFSLLVDVACVVTGWFVARLHPRHAVGMVCLFAVSVFLVLYGTIAWKLAAQPVPTYVPNRDLFIIPVLTVGQPLGVIIGGLCGTRSSPDPLPAVLAD
jgi:hypothetical protein